MLKIDGVSFHFYVTNVEYGLLNLENNLLKQKGFLLVSFCQWQLSSMVLACDKMVENKFTTQRGALNRRYNKLAGNMANKNNN